MRKQQISVIVTDLDNTIFNWFDIWYYPFNAMLSKIEEISGINREKLIPEIKEIHQKYGTAEYAFLIQEIPSLQKLHPNEDLTVIYDDAIHAFSSERKKHLKLYEGVKDTLWFLKNKGCLVVAYTESMAYYTNYRIRKLELDGLIDCLYSSQDHVLYRDRESIRKYSGEDYKLKKTKHRFTPADEAKPNPELLKDIIKDIDGNINECIYVGDSLFKDIAMAQDACITDVHAEYGVAHLTKEYELLKKVTHWKKEDVELEEKSNDKKIIPSYTLKSFSELQDLFEYVPFNKANLERVVDIWKKTVDVQQHFNDIALKIRSLAITILGVAIGAYGLRNLQNIEPFTISSVSFALTLAWIAFFFMDRYHYHPLLLGAVKHGKMIEDKYKNLLPEIGLTDAIKEASPVKFIFCSLHSQSKINIFYTIGFVIISMPWIGYSIWKPFWEVLLKPSLIDIIYKFI